MPPWLEIITGILWVVLATVALWLFEDSKSYKRQEEIRNNQLANVGFGEVLGHPGCFYFFLGLLPGGLLTLIGVIRLVSHLLFH